MNDKLNYHTSMNTTDRYELICKLINEDIDEAVAEDFDSTMYDKPEDYRNSLIENYCNFLKKDLQSDNKAQIKTFESS